MTGDSPLYEIHDEVHRIPTDTLDAFAARAATLQAESVERAARRAHERALGSRLRWLVNHPRLLDWAYRLRLAKRPTMTMPMRLSLTTAFDVGGGVVESDG